MRDFRDIKIWDKAHKLVVEIYKISALFPKNEQYGLTSQIRRAAVSIPSNIAEGSGRGSKKELKQFMIVSSSSASEVEYQILLALDLGYISKLIYEKLNEKIVEIKKMLNSYINKIERTNI